MFKPEIVSPGGNLEKALYALQGGADAVYCGYKTFSAREAAGNLSLHDFRLLKGYAAARGKKLYLALNTILKEAEWEAAFTIVNELYACGIDAVIIQDLGLLYLLRKYLPALRLHASTQLAVCHDYGIKMLADWGVSRVVLARELSLQEITRIKNDNPTMEMEVFVHGALCYAVSGLCLASGLLLGRSANRGQCAQVCRTYFNDESGKPLYPFSCRDLMLKEDILGLQDSGIDALKIEGRMKSKEYAGLTAQYYRSILDNRHTDLYERCLCTFARLPSPGFYQAGSPLTDPLFSGHRGLKLGKPLEIKKKSFVLKTPYLLAKRDGLLFLDHGKFNSAVLTSVGAVKQGSSGQEIFTSQLPSRTHTIYKTSAHDQNWPQFKTGSLKPAGLRVRALLTLKPKSLQIKMVSAYFPDWECEFPLSLFPSSGGQDIAEIITKVLYKTTDGRFAWEQFTVHNQSGWENSAIFIQPSALKQVKTVLFRELERHWAAAGQALLARIKTDLSTQKTPATSGRHNRLSAWAESVHTWGFYTSLNTIPSFAVEPGLYILPLLPVNFGLDFFAELEGYIRSSSGLHFLLGLNNLAHLYFAQRLADLPQVSFYIDYGLYSANLAAINFFNSVLPKIEFILYYIEGSSLDFSALAAELPNLFAIKNKEALPLFISRVCYAKETRTQNCQDCPRDFEYLLYQNNRKFRVQVANCLSFVLAVAMHSGKQKVRTPKSKHGKDKTDDAD